jgi:DNA repair protein RadC
VNELTKGYEAHRLRLREKYRTAGISALHDYEILELLLTFVIPRRDVKPLAKQMIQKFSSVANVLDATDNELMDINGIGANTVVMLHLIKDVCAKYFENRTTETDILSNPEIVIEYARVKLSGLKHEAFIALFVNPRNHVVGNMRLDGTVDCAAIYPRDIIKKALDVNATGIIIIHNHPSGNCEPSSQDVNLTTKIKAACETINIRLLDHLIVGKGGYCSLAERGMIGTNFTT